MKADLKALAALAAIIGPTTNAPVYSNRPAPDHLTADERRELRARRKAERDRKRDQRRKGRR